MRIVNIIGGIGNQMFQMALVVALKKEYPSEEIKICTRAFNGYKLHNGYELNTAFNIPFVEATTTELLKVAYPYLNFRLWRYGRRLLPKRSSMCLELESKGFNSKVLTESEYKYFDGYWQNEKYFINAKSEVRQIFNFKNTPSEKNKVLLQKINGLKLASIHVRRGDYLSNPLYNGICDREYYKEAISYLTNRRNIDCFLIFSNDIEWCKKNIAPLINNKEVIYIDWNIGNKDYVDIKLMSQCNYNIIANSSFSWWGGWLNESQDKLVIAPKMWTNKLNSNNVVPDDWTTL